MTSDEMESGWSELATYLGIAISRLQATRSDLNDGLPLTSATADAIYDMWWFVKHAGEAKPAASAMAAKAIADKYEAVFSNAYKHRTRGEHDRVYV